VEKSGGLALMKIYPSLKEALTSIYPTYPWDLTKFSSRVADHHWETKANLIDALRLAEQRLGVGKVNYLPIAFPPPPGLQRIEFFVPIG